MFGKKRKGQALVEFSLVIVLFLFIILGTIDFGLFLYSTIILDTATRDGVRVAVVRTDWGTNYDDIVEEIKDVVEDRSRFLPETTGLRGRTIVTLTPSAIDPESITVEVRNQPYNTISGFLGLILPDDISTGATMRYEKR
ncbi:TadE/TadG family type IV pilus assembly protein [Candidatus Margulisiibacteriota bacterium]